MLNDTNRELRTISFDILNDTSEEREGTHTPNYCQLQGMAYSFVLHAVSSMLYVIITQLHTVATAVAMYIRMWLHVQLLLYNKTIKILATN